MERYWILILSLFTLFALAQSNKKGLVVLDDLNARNTHSIFFKNLEDKGFQLTYAEGSQPQLELSRYGNYLYDFLILFAPHTEAFGGSLTVDSILNFIDDGRNVIVATDNTVSDAVRELAVECGVEFGDDNSFVIDHHNFDSSDFDGDHTLVVADDLIQSPLIVGKVNSPILFKGISQYLEPDNSLVFPVLKAAATAYGHSPDEAIDDVPHVAGKQTVLISALQARNNARVIFSGSLDLFSDRFFTSSVQKYTPDNSGKKYERSGNEQLISNLVSWVLKDKGVLRLSNVNHHRVNEKDSDHIYAVKEDIVYSVDIEEWDGSKWVPYKGNDVQVEFVMLDPYIRATLKHDDKGHYSAAFKVPDVYGIFTFRLDYARAGYTSLFHSETVVVRPFRHNEYERFIVAAYPYYASAFSMMFGVVIFSLFFLYHKDEKKGK